jgi:hypothetical protein
VKVRIRAAIVIDRPVEDVFDFVAVRHRENHSLWDVAVSRIEPVTTGPMGLGARFTIVRRNVVAEEDRTFTITRWEPPRLMEMRTEKSDFALVLRGEFEALGAGVTRHSIVGEATVAGLRSLLIPVLKLKFTRDIQANLRCIKSLIEGEGQVPRLASESALR